MSFFIKLFRKPKVEVPAQPFEIYENSLFISRGDDRDYYVSGAIEGSEAEEIYLHKKIPIRNQRWLGSCASHAIIFAYEYQLYEDNDYVELSEMYHYYFARESRGNESVNAGMTLRDGMKTIVKGTCFERFWPYDCTKYDVKPSVFADICRKLFTNSRFGIHKYFRVYNYDDMEYWLKQGVPIIAGINMFDKFKSHFNDKNSLKIKDLNKASVFSGHAVNVTGIDDDHVEIRNSWGTTYGDKGYVKFTRELFDKVCFEMWVIVK